MVTQQQRELYQAAINKWGVKAQVIKAIEEMAELTVNLAKRLNSLEVSDEQLIDEVADNVVMAGQLCIIMGEKLVEKRIQEKEKYLQTLLE